MDKNLFFKYREINKRLIDSLVNGTIYFAAPKYLNDPFDCRIDIKNSITNALKETPQEEKKILQDLLAQDVVFKGLREDVMELGICSFSLDLKINTMWTHYTSNHRGVCVLYEFTNDFINNPDNGFLGASSVSYDENSLTNWFKDYATSPTKNFAKFYIDVAKKVLTSKSPAWKEEKEYRIIRKNPGLLNIPKAFVKQICFGLRTPKEDIELVKNIAEKFGESISYHSLEP